MFPKLVSMNGLDSYEYTKFMIQSGPHMEAELQVWDAKNFSPVKFVKKSLMVLKHRKLPHGCFTVYFNETFDSTMLIQGISLYD